MNKRNGFTLVELMGILVVLALIIAIAVPTITSTLRKQGDNQEELYVNQVCTAAKAYMNFYRLENDNELATQYQRILNGILPVAFTTIKVDKLIDEGYLSDSTKHPKQGNNDGIEVRFEGRADGPPNCRLN